MGWATAQGHDQLKPIVIHVHVLMDQGAHSGKGLGEGERSRFQRYQEKARREFATSGILFEVDVMEGAYLRKHGYAQIPYQFLARKKINLFVTDTLGYEIDKDRTGGSSVGPYARGPSFAANTHYQTYLGLREASEATLSHEYAHHFALDTQQRSWAGSNFWADFRNDFWLWRQRHGATIAGFRACANAEWARADP